MTALSEAARPLMWNISAGWIMYPLFLIALGFFLFGAWRHVASWRRGKPQGEKLADWGKRLGLLLKELLLQPRVRGSRFPGLMHSLIFYSFLVLIVTTAVIALDYDLGTHLFRGYLYVGLTVAAELGGLLILVGVGMAAWRRLVRKPATLPSSFKDQWPLLLIGLIIATGFLLEGLRLAAEPDPWAALSPVGAGLGLAFAGLSPGATRGAHVGLWWLHVVLSMAWIASIPYSKFVHLLALPTNIFLSRLRPRGELQRVNILELMESESFDPETFKVGVETHRDLTWKQRLDLDACISCGRCEEVCPATQCGNPFSPRDFLARCRQQLQTAEANGAANQDVATPAAGQEDGEGAEPSRAEATVATPAALVGQAFDEKYIWYCRTCTACMEVCPACIDHVGTLIEVRRNEVMMQGRAPADAARALKTLETRGSPFGSQSVRVEWMDKLGVRVVKPGERCDVLLWVGCCTSFDPTKQRIAEDLCKLLKLCGIDFGILGADERCCGDPARVLGDERLFQEVATGQIETIKSRQFDVLLTSCPHCYNVMKNEYPQFGGDFHVAHHSEFLHEMIWSRSLLPRMGLVRRMVYHDPCYLGRYQKVYEAPRQVLKALPGAQILEMKDSRERSMCCGGGGGHSWMDLRAAHRINNLRTQQARALGADTIVTSCAYCKQMLEDAVKAADLTEEMEVLDIASLVLASVQERGKEDAAGQQGTGGLERNGTGG